MFCLRHVPVAIVWSLTRRFYVLAGTFALAAVAAAASVQSPNLVLRYPAPEPAPDKALAISVLFSADGKTLVALNMYGYDWSGAPIAAWNAQTGEALRIAGPGSFPQDICRVGERTAVVERARDANPPVFARIRTIATGPAQFDDFIVPPGALRGGRWPSRLGIHATLAPTEHLAACMSSTEILGAKEVGNENRDALPPFGDVLLFDPANGALLRNLKPPPDLLEKEPNASITDLVFSPNSQRIAGVTRSGSLFVWSCEDGTLQASYFSDKRAKHEPVRLYREGANLHSVDACKLLWMSNDAVITALIPRTDSGQTDFRRLQMWVLTEEAPEVISWTAPSVPETAPGQNPAAKLAQGREYPRFLARSPDGSRVLLVLSDSQSDKMATQAIEIVDVGARAALGRLEVPRASSVVSIAFTPDSSRVALAIRNGSILVTTKAQLESFARQGKSIVELSSANLPPPKERTAKRGVKPAAAMQDRKPAPEDASSSETEFRLPRTGLFLRSRLSVVSPWWPPDSVREPPAQMQLGGSATLHYFINALDKSQTFDSACTALRKQLIETPHQEGDEYVQEFPQVEGVNLCLFSQPPAAKNPLARERYHDVRVMHAVVADNTMLVRALVYYPYASNELYSQLREMFLHLRWSANHVFDPFEGLGWRGTLPEGLKPVSCTQLMLTPTGNAGEHGTEWGPRDFDPSPVVWITPRWGMNEFALEDTRATDAHWFDAASRALSSIRGGVVLSSKPFEGIGTVGWELVIANSDATLTYYQAILGGPIETGGSLIKSHRAKVRVVGMVATDGAEAWIPRFRALATSLVRKE